MGEALINAQRGGQWQAFSAGSHPEKAVNPNALAVLAETGIQHKGTPQHINEYIGQDFDLVITVCDHAAEVCPVWPGQGRREHVSFPDPANATGTPEEVLAVYRQVRDDMVRRVLPLLDTIADERM
ncbi:MAG: arsenate reductase ArsC [Anaerolineaceae bacterium]|nr:arsenate reductase ArsC [Anaerolineaceae bacterium]